MPIRGAVPTVLIGLMAVMLAASGCQRASDVPGAPAPGDGPIKIVYIPKNLGNPYFDAVVEGFRETAATAGYEFEQTGPAEPGPTAQIPFIEAAIQRKVSAIAISPNDDLALLPSLERAQAAGIKVITVNSDMKATEGRDVAIMPADFAPMGTFLLDLLGEQLEFAGTFAILSATSTAPDQNTWIDGVTSALATDPRYANMKLVDVVYGDDQVDRSTRQARALLTKHPDLDGIIAPTAVGLPAAAKVVGESPRKGEVVLTGLALPNSMRSYVKDGTVRKFGLWDPEREGVIAGHLLVGLVTGTISAEPGTRFDAGRLGPMTINPSGQVISGPLQSFDASNIDQFDF